MRKLKLALLSGALVAAGALVAISAPGPRGEGGMRGWLHPRSMTADQYDTRTRERFARLDRNSDGVLDATEIEAAVKDHFGRGHKGSGQRDGHDHSSGFLREFGDKDGKVTKDAFIAEAKRRFAELDLNNDGKITDDDLPPMLRGKGVLNKSDGRKGRERMGGMLQELRRADAGPDGAISLDAFVAAQTKRFDSLDRNKDGIVDKADFDLMHKEMTDYQVKRFLHHYGATDGKVTRDQYFKVAKEQFARLDKKGEGRIEFRPRDAGGRRGPGRPDGVLDGAPDGARGGLPGAPTKN